MRAKLKTVDILQPRMGAIRLAGNVLKPLDGESLLGLALHIRVIVNQPRKTRMAVVNSHPIQYFAPLYAYLNASDEFEVTALYCTDFSLRDGNDPGFKQALSWDIDLLAGYSAVFLGERARIRNPSGFFSLLVLEVWREVRSGKYDVVLIHGHQYAAYLLALLAAKTRGIPVMMRCDTHLGMRGSRLKQALRKLLIGALYRRCDRLLAIGSANRDFYREIGIPEEKIFLVPLAVDNQRFMAASSLTETERASMLQRLGAPPDKPVLLYASKFQRRKRPDDVLRAAAQLRERGLDFTVMMVGSGEMQAELAQLTHELRLDNVIFPGFINQSELPRVYGASDIFVLPSENEPWGLIVNEVMCAGLPVVISDEVGCVPDLVKDGENGFLFKAGDLAGLVEAVERLLIDTQLSKRMGERSREHIAQWSYTQCLDGIAAAVRGLPYADSGGLT